MSFQPEVGMLVGGGTMLHSRILEITSTMPGLLGTIGLIEWALGSFGIVGLSGGGQSSRGRLSLRARPCTCHLRDYKHSKGTQLHKPGATLEVSFGSLSCMNL